MRFARIFLVLLLLPTFTTVFAQPGILWTRVIGTDDSEYCYSVQQTTDGGFILAGKSISAEDGNIDFLLVKTDGDGNTTWRRTYGGDDVEVCYDVRQTGDGGYIMAGSVQQLGNGDYNIRLLKVDADGEELWSRDYGENGRDECFSVRQTNDGGYILAGSSNSYSDFYAMFIIRTDGAGDVRWTRTYNVGQWCGAVLQTSDGGFVVGGSGRYGLTMVKSNNEGNSSWHKTWMGGNSLDEGWSLSETPDSHILLAGHRGNLDPNFLLTKTTLEGDTLWAHQFGGQGVDRCYTVKYTHVGNYIIAGFTTSYEEYQGAVLLISTNPDGEQLWRQTYSDEDGATWDCRSAQQLHDDGYILAGTSFRAGNDNMLLIRTETDMTGRSEGLRMSLPRAHTLHPAWPNPFNPETSLQLDLADDAEVRVEVFNLVGERVAVLAEGWRTAGRHVLRFDGSGLSAGTYYVRVMSPGWIGASRKVMLVK